jgi:hypothetical protein
MVRYYLELLLIAEKGKIDEYVKNTKASDWLQEGCNLALDNSFPWSDSPEGMLFWEDIFLEAGQLVEEGMYA